MPTRASERFLLEDQIEEFTPTWKNLNSHNITFFSRIIACVCL